MPHKKPVSKAKASATKPHLSASDAQRAPIPARTPAATAPKKLSSSSTITNTERKMSPSHNQSNQNQSSANANGAQFFMVSPEEFAAQARANGEAAMKSFQTLMAGMNQISQTLAQAAQNAMQMTMAAAQAASSVRNLRDLAELQNDYAKTSIDAIVENSTRISELSLKTANDAAQPISQRVNETVQKFSQRTAA